jgi:hypothetical protein
VFTRPPQDVSREIDAAGVHEAISNCLREMDTTGIHETTSVKWRLLVPMRPPP